MNRKSVIGVSAQFNVTGLSDSMPPEVVSFSFSPDTVDAGSSNRQISIAVRLRDDRSGLADAGYDQYGRPLYYTCAYGAFRSPSGRQVLPIGFGVYHRTNGDSLDGTYTNGADLLQFCEPGIWSLDYFYAVDAVGNRALFYNGQLLARGFPVNLTGTGLGDTNTPLLTGFSLAPTNINTTYSPQSIQVTAHVTDDLSGFGFLPSNGGRAGFVSANFVSPSGRQLSGLTLQPPFQTPVVLLDSTLTNTLTLPRYSEPGLWLLRSVVIMDNAVNQRPLDLAAVRALGLPVSFTVEEFPPLRLAISGGIAYVSRPANAIGFKLQTSADCSNPAAWSDVSARPLEFGEEIVLASPVEAGPRLYRLIK